jgi:hypothetical protein
LATDEPPYFCTTTGIVDLRAAILRGDGRVGGACGPLTLEAPALTLAWCS